MIDRILIEARNRTLAIEGGIIAEPNGRYDLVLRFPDGEVRPGLINAHDHLHRNHYGRLGSPPYPDAHVWGFDIQQRYRFQIEAGRALPRRKALLAGAWKNLFAGVTTVVHHDPWEPDFADRFPLRVLRIACADSLATAPARAEIDPDNPFCLHLAEGCGRASADEVRRLYATGLLRRNLIAVHGVGMDREAVDLFRASGAALVWCPSSNDFLFGRTVRPELLREGLDVLLGSDSLLSGAGNLLDELHFARASGLLGDERLVDAVGATAARRLGIAPPLLERGERADMIVLARPLLEASAEDVELVVANGVPRVARPLAGLTGIGGCIATVAGVIRWVNPACEPQIRPDCEPEACPSATTA